MSADIGTYTLGSAVVTFNRYGDPIMSSTRKVTLSADQRKVRTVPRATLGFDQAIWLPKGDDYLFLSVWDKTTGRLGVITMQLNAAPPPTPKRAGNQP